VTQRSLIFLGAAAAACTATAAAAGPPSFALLPARVGATAIYGYQLDANGPRGTQSLRGVVLITRLANGRAVVTLAPDVGNAAAVGAAIAADGTLHAAPPSSSDVPSEGFGRAFPASIPPGLRALAALLVTPATGPTWPLAVEAGDGVAPATLSLTASTRPAASDADRTYAADGSGTVEVAQPAAPRERGGFGRGGGGGGGGGGGFGFPGGGGGGRRGGGEGGAAPQRVAATVALHVEASFRAATFLGARGTETTTPQQGDTTATTATWSLWPY
jgi:uncharacterized membrane protein YgcG